MSNADKTQASATNLDFSETNLSLKESTASSNLPTFESAHESANGSEDNTLNSNNKENYVLTSNDGDIEEIKKLRESAEMNTEIKKRNEKPNVGEQFEIKQVKNSLKKKKKKKKKAETESVQPFTDIDPDASIDYNTKTLYTSSSLLPFNEYETVLKRRIHYISMKIDPSTDNKNTSITSQVTNKKPTQINTHKRSIFNNTKYTSSLTVSDDSLNGNINFQSSASITTPSDLSNESSNDENKILVLDKNVEQDYSLGMQLTILGGRVIVQSVNELKDGRASPAQLSGRIQRGDVLVKINSTSLRKMGGTSLMEALNVLSGADTSSSSTAQTTSSTYINGNSYISRYINVDEEEQEKQREKQHLEFVQKELKLRFVAGEGLRLLQDGEEVQGQALVKPNVLQRSTSQVNNFVKKYSTRDVDILSTLSHLFPKDFQLVDQFTGMPYQFEQSDDTENVGQTKKDNVSTIQPKTEEEKDERSIENHYKNNLRVVPIVEMDISPLSLMIPSKLTLQIIADQIASKMLNDKWTSAYFQLDPNCSDLMKTSLSHLSRSSDDESHTHEANKYHFKSLLDLLEYGGKVMQGAGMILDNIQKTDESLSYGDIDNYLRSSGKKRLKETSNTGAILELNGIGTDDNDDGLGNLTDDDDITVESLLISDAWKQRILYQLQQAIDYTAKKNPQSVSLIPESANSSNQGKPLSSEANKSGSAENQNIYALKNENEDNDSTALETLLFGGVQQAKSLTSQTKCLPPLQITTSLYDMVMGLERSVGNMTINTTSSRRSNTMGESVIGRSVSSLSQRRLTSGRSITALMSKDRVIADKVYFLLQEALPLWLTTFSPLGINLRRILWPRNQVINNGSMFHDQGDDVSLISMGGVSSFSLGGSAYGGGKAKQWRDIIEENKLNPASRTQTQSNTDTNKIFDFMKKFGAYLNLYTCLVSASNACIQEVVDSLLDIAKHDLHHIDAMATISKKGTLILYEPVLLSALLESIKASALDDDAIPLLTSAYPDLKPWQIKKYCISNGSKNSLSFYYKYLSHLLHTSDGSNKARHERELVSEWGELTVSDQFISDYKNNFYEIVSPRNERLYYRDLPLLLNLSMKLSDIDLVLNLVQEILDHPRYRIKLEVILSVLDHLREIGKTIIEQKNEKQKKMKLKRMLQYLENISKLKSDKDFQNIDVSDQLFYLLESCLNSSTTNSQKEFIEFLSDHGRPNDVLKALEKWKGGNETDIPSSFYFGILQKLLKRAARESYKKKSTGVLLRVQKARENEKKALASPESKSFSSGISFVVKVNSESALEYSSENSVSVWEKLQNGECVIDK